MGHLMKFSTFAPAGLAVLLATASALPALAADDNNVALDSVIVTATAQPELRSRVAGTVQVISEETIARSTAKNLTELFAENSVAFLSEWTPAQTSINIRGGASDGQGRDYLGDVLVLVNGRRAGTANMAKLSANDVAKIEIVRGPASVLYGSQNIGGVVNVILKNGKTSPGYGFNVSTGTSGLLQGGLNIGKDFGAVDVYLGLNGARKGDYKSGKGGTRMKNTAFTRHGITAGLGWDINDLNRVAVEGRSDGVYDAGFRGSGSNTIAFDDRDNRSLDLTYDGRTADGRFSWKANGYIVADVDELWQASPIVKNGTVPGPGTSADYNLRHQWINGFQIRPTAKLWTGAALTVGVDGERSVLRSKRYRQGVPGNVLAQTTPQDNNQTDKNYALYGELSQNLLDDKVTLRGGLRHTEGKMDFDPTPNLALQVANSVKYDANTWSVGGTWRPIEGLALRAGASSGFRVPSATQLGADFTALGGGRTFGNPNLKPETSEQYEVGAIWSQPNFFADVALFQNKISDRITTLARTPASLNTSDYINNPAELLIRGVELQTDTNINGWIAPDSAYSWTLRASGYYNLDMADKGAPATARTNNIQRMYRYEASFNNRFGGKVAERDWGVELIGILRGPVYYDTEENLLIPQGEPVGTYVHRKAPFWIFNLKGEVAVTEQFTVSASVNNLLNKNYHALFIAEDKDPRLADPRFQNGGLGTSAPGREFVLRLTGRF